MKKDFILKIDNSSPTRASNIISNKQKHNDKSTSAMLSGSLQPEINQAENNSHINLSSILSHSIENNSENMDAAKIVEIKRAIIEGRFKVNSEVVADQLLKTVKDLIQAKKNNT